MSKRKKILFVSARLPFPAIEGHQIRAFGVLSQLAKEFEVHLLSILRSGEVVNSEDDLGLLCSSIKGVALDNNILSDFRAGLSGVIKRQPLVVAKYVTSNLKKEFLKQLELIKPDIVHLDLLPLAGLIGLIPKNIKIVLNEHNIESNLIQQKLLTLDSWFSKKLYQRELKQLTDFERSSCKSVDLVLACSDQDVIGLKALGAEQVHCIPNGVDAERLKPNNTNKLEKTLVFLGGMSWYPNRLGIIWFLEEVFPLILKLDPDVCLQIIGNPEPWVTVPEGVKENVEKLGFVDDFIPYVQNSALMIVPLNVGSGTRLKVVEGLALGKCIVSTTKGAEGVGLTHGKDILFADSPHEFAEQVIQAIQSSNIISDIELKARKIAEEKYDWNVIGENLYNIYSVI
ncbi:MAG: hypothetical protein COA78_29875 [Blastopirellula sp.]|nr:MAG: hypothetical protein COA78_29875 [Blastopirellula sp.]